nr:prophage MuMc02 [uncultured Mediterranean phage uvMED]
MTTNIKDYSTTQASNTSLNSIDVGEGMLPSNLNNSIRALMKNTRDWFNDAQWTEYGDGSGAYTAAYASGTSFTINGVDVTSIYHAGRRIKLTASTPGTIFGTIASSSFSTNTTINVTWDSGSLSNEAISNVYVASLSKTNDSIPTGISATKLADGSISNTEFQYLNGVSSAIQTQLDAKQPTITGSASTIDTESLTANRAVISNGSQKIAVSDVTDTELGYLDGVTSSVQTQIDSKQATITGGASTIASSDLTVSRALQSNGSGKVEVSDVTTTELGYLDGVSSAIQTQIDGKQNSDAQLTDIAGLTPTDSNFIVGDGSNFVTESGATARTSLGLGSISTQASNNVSISGGSVTGLGSPSSNSDAATKSYVDQAVAGLRTRTIAECSSTANVNISNGLEAGDSIDGVTLVAGDRVLLKDQSTASENGLYLAVSSGAASRDPEHDSIAELSGGMVVVNQGSTNDNKIFLCTTDNTGSVGSTSITYTVITPSNTGTVTSVGVADSGAGEFTVGSTPVTSSGNITLAINSIADSKLGTISTANKVSVSALNIDGATDIGADLTTSDLIVVDDGAGGTNRKAALSRMVTLVDENSSKASAGFAIAMSVAL